MLSASIPDSSANATAARRTRSRLSGVRRPVSAWRPAPAVWLLVCMAAPIDGVRRTPYATPRKVYAVHLEVSCNEHRKERAMKAIICRAYGPPEEVLQLVDIEEPDVADDEVLVDVHATSVNPVDWHIVRGIPYVARLQIGVRAPRFT